MWPLLFGSCGCSIQCPAPTRSSVGCPLSGVTYGARSRPCQLILIRGRVGKCTHTIAHAQTACQQRPPVNKRNRRISMQKRGVRPQPWGRAWTPRGISLQTGENALRARTCAMLRIRARGLAGDAVKKTGLWGLGRKGDGSLKTTVSNHLSTQKTRPSQHQFNGSARTACWRNQVSSSLNRRAPISYRPTRKEKASISSNASRYPFTQIRNAAMVVTATRLLPSTNGWFRDRLSQSAAAS